MIKSLTFDELLKDFSPEGRGEVLAAIERTGATAVVLFENIDFCSSQFGRQTALCVGPTCTFKAVDEVEGHHLNDLPSQRMYPQAFAHVPEKTNGTA